MAHSVDGQLAGPVLRSCGWVTYICSPHSPVRVACVDPTEALRLPGVIAVLTETDVHLAPGTLADPVLARATVIRSQLASGALGRSGQPVAGVVTEGRDQGLTAAALVLVEYEPASVGVASERRRNEDGPPLGTATSQWRDRSPTGW